MRIHKIETTNHEINDNPAITGPSQCVVSGNNFVYAYNDSGTLRIKYMDIKSPSAGDPELIKTNGTQSYSKANLWTSVYNGTRWMAMERIGSTIYACFWTGTTGSHTLNYIASTDNGETWATDTQAQSGDDSYQIATNLQIFNITFTNSTPYAITHDEINPKLYIYDLSTFNEAYTDINNVYTSGYYDPDDSDFKFVRITDSDPEWEIRLVSFNGSTVSVEETIDLTNTLELNGYDMHNCYIFRKMVTGTLFFFALAEHSASGNVCYIRHGDPTTSVWRKVNFTGAPGLHVAWNDYSYMDPRFIHIGGSIDSIYIISRKGYLVKVSHEATATISHGINAFMYPYTFQPVDYPEVYNAVLHEKHLNPRSLVVESVEQEFQKGDGMVYTNDDFGDIVYFIGELVDTENDLEGQRARFIEPSYVDLEREITVSYSSKTCTEILKDILDEYCIFLWYNLNIESTVTTYTIEWKNTKIKEIFKWLEEREYKIIYWNGEGEIYYDDGDYAESALQETNGDLSDIIEDNLGKDFNGVLLRGGLKSDGTLAKLLRVEYIDDTAQYNIFTVDVPHMTNDTDAPGNEMYDYGTQLLANRDSAFTSLRFTYFDQNKRQLGSDLPIVAATYGINGNYIPMEQKWYPDGSYGEMLKCYSGLYFKATTEETTLPESNREVIGQVAEEVATKFGSSGGTITGQVIINYNDDVDLVGVSGSLIIGGDGSGQHIAIDNDEIQSKSDGTTAATLLLQNEGGLLDIGGNVEIAGTLDVTGITTITANVSIYKATGATQLEVESDDDQVNIIADAGLSQYAILRFRQGGNDRAAIFVNDTNADLYIRTYNSADPIIMYPNGIGVATFDDTLISFTQQVTITETAYPVLDVIRTSSSTNSLYGVIRTIHETSGNAVDGLGSGIYFGFTDSGISDQSLGGIGAVRDGADNTGKLRFDVVVSGSTIEKMSLSDTLLLTDDVDVTIERDDNHAILTVRSTLDDRQAFLILDGYDDSLIYFRENTNNRVRFQYDQSQNRLEQALYQANDSFVWIADSAVADQIIMTLSGGPSGTDTRLTLSSTSIGDDVQIHLDSEDDSYLLLMEDGNNRLTLYYDAGANYGYIRFYQSGDSFRIYDDSANELTRITADNSSFYTHVIAQSGHSVYAYDSGNTDYNRMLHDGTNAHLHTNVGSQKLRGSSTLIRNAADSAYAEIYAAEFNDTVPTIDPSRTNLAALEKVTNVNERSQYPTDVFKGEQTINLGNAIQWLIQALIEENIKVKELEDKVTILESRIGG